MELQDFKDVLNEIHEPGKNRLELIATGSYNYKLLKTTLGRRVELTSSSKISWELLFAAYREAKQDVGYFM